MIIECCLVRGKCEQGPGVIEEVNEYEELHHGYSSYANDNCNPTNAAPSSHVSRVYLDVQGRYVAISVCKSRRKLFYQLRN